MTADRPRILHVIPSTQGGGAERQLSYLAPEQVRQGWDVHVAYLHDGPNRATLERSGVVLTKIASSSNYDPLILWRLLILVRQLQPRLIQTWLAQMDFFGGMAAVATRTPFILSERASRIHYERYEPRWKNALRQFFGRRARAIVANSVSGCEYWRECTPRVPCTVIRNGIALDELRSVQPMDLDDLGVGSEDELIVFAGRYAPQKNVFVMLQALDRVLARRPRAIALLFGEGPLRNEVIAMRDSLPMAARIHVRGYAVELWRVLKRARVFVSVSTYEGNPNTVLEAVAMGCPVVLSDIPTHREFLDETHACFAPTEAPDSIAGHIENVLEEPGHAAERARAGQALLTQWTFESAARHYLELYDSVLKAGI